MTKQVHIACMKFIFSVYQRVEKSRTRAAGRWHVNELRLNARVSGKGGRGTWVHFRGYEQTVSNSEFFAAAKIISESQSSRCQRPVI